MDEAEIKDELKECILYLEKFSETELLDYIFSHYRQNIHSYFVASFTADTNFRLLLYTGWIFITAENKHHRLIQFLESRKYAMLSNGPKSSVYAFYADNRELVISDFDIIKDLWKHVRYIRRIVIESHNIIFTRYQPRTLSALCWASIQANNIKPNWPKTVMLKLGYIDVS